MGNTSLGTWSFSTRDFSALLNLRIRQELLQRKLLPGELMQFILEIEDKVMETSCDEKELSLEEVELMLENAITIFGQDIE